MGIQSLTVELLARWVPARKVQYLYWKVMIQELKHKPVLLLVPQKEGFDQLQWSLCSTFNAVLFSTLKWPVPSGTHKTKKWNNYLLTAACKGSWVNSPESSAQPRLLNALFGMGYRWQQLILCPCQGLLSYATEHFASFLSPYQMGSAVLCYNISNSSITSQALIQVTAPQFHGWCGIKKQYI